MIFDLVNAHVEKQHPLGTVTWGDLKKLIEKFQTSILVDIESNPVELTQKEKDFIQYVAKDMETKQIAQAMGKSPRTIEALRLSLRGKTGTKTNVGLILYAIKAGLLRIDKVKPEVVADEKIIS